MPTIHLIISGGIAAYKALELIRRLREAGWRVVPILTAAGKQFVTPLSVAALAGERVYETLWSLTDEAEMGHIRLARDPDLIVVAPATANIMAKMAHGLADDLATAVLLATDRPVLIAPAMNPHMWENAATRDNAAALAARGVHFVGPNGGDMACGEFGTGRMAEVPEILAAVERIAGARPLAGKHAIVTAGATQEPIDPVRFITNGSSGLQGVEIAAALARAGARVTLIHGAMQVGLPTVPAFAGMTTIWARTAEEMFAAVQRSLPADIYIGAAAVADYAPVEVAKQKMKKDSPLPAGRGSGEAGGEGGVKNESISFSSNPPHPALRATFSRQGEGNIVVEFRPTVDILKSISAHPGRPKLVIGFALETENHLAHARAKLAAKGCDWMMLNDAAAMDAGENKITLLSGAEILEWPLISKHSVAIRLTEKIVNHFAMENPDASPDCSSHL